MCTMPCSCILSPIGSLVYLTLVVSNIRLKLPFVSEYGANVHVYVGVIRMFQWSIEL